jgi:hypothetical protein
MRIGSEEDGMKTEKRGSLFGKKWLTGSDDQYENLVCAFKVEEVTSSPILSNGYRPERTFGPTHGDKEEITPINLGVYLRVLECSVNAL